MIEQDYREKAKRILKDFSQELGILLPMKGGVIDYTQAIEAGSTAITYAIAAMNTACIILTSNPENIKFDRFDRIMHWVKTTHVGQHLSGKFAHRQNNQLPILTPEQFVARSSRVQRHDSDSACKRESQKISHTKADFTPLWQKTPGATVSFQARERIKVGSDNQEGDTTDSISCSHGL